MTESNTTLMLEIMEDRLHCSCSCSNEDMQYRGMLNMFSQLICTENEEKTCKEVITYFIDNNEISGKERAEFAKTVVSFDFFIENYERAITDGYIASNVNARFMLDVFKIFKHSNTMDIVFYEKFGTRAEYWNARLNNISKISECHEMINEGTMNIIHNSKYLLWTSFVFADNSALQLVTDRDTVLAHTVIED